MNFGKNQADAIVKLLDPQSAANTAAATSGWIDVRQYIGDVEFEIATGAISAGSISWDIQDATDNAGSGSASIAASLAEGATFVNTANQVQKKSIKAHSTRGFVRVIGTIVTGPVLVQAALQSMPKNT
jgi:hypothetical protein